MAGGSRLLRWCPQRLESGPHLGAKPCPDQQKPLESLWSEPDNTSPNVAAIRQSWADFNRLSQDVGRTWPKSARLYPAMPNICVGIVTATIQNDAHRRNLRVSQESDRATSPQNSREIPKHPPESPKLPLTRTPASDPTPSPHIPHTLRQPPRRRRGSSLGA